MGDSVWCDLQHQGFMGKAKQGIADSITYTQQGLESAKNKFNGNSSTTTATTAAGPAAGTAHTATSAAQPAVGSTAATGTTATTTGAGRGFPAPTQL